MASDKCFACSGTLTPTDGGKLGTCDNPQCPGGTRFHPCGYCRELSFAARLDRMRCYNRDCRMYDVHRTQCPACQKISLIQNGEGTLCINRGCPQNEGVVVDCFFCHSDHGQKSFLNRPEVMFCTKGDCDYLRRRVEPCDVCLKLSFVVDERMCKNEACEISGKEVEKCSLCGLRTLAHDSKGASVCLNPQCGFRTTVKDLDVLETKDFGATLEGPMRAPAAPLLPTKVAPSRPAPVPAAPGPKPDAVVRPQAPPERRGSPARPGVSAIEEAYQVLRSSLLQGAGRASPLYLIIGLPGSGKTVYLTMLGALLGFRQQRFAFPYSGVEPNWVKVDKLVAKHQGGIDPRQLQQVSARIRDLVFNFGQEIYDTYIARGLWPPATAHAEDDDGHPATYFLVSEIVRHMKALANVVTLETSGEHYQEVLRDYQKYVQGGQPRNPTQRVLVDMMNMAEGYIVLFDPDAADNDTIFKNFFLVLKDGLRSRALNRFYSELGQSVGGGKEDLLRPGRVADVRRLIQLIRDDDRRRQAYEAQFAAERRLLADRLAETGRKLEAGRVDILEGEEGKWLNELKAVLGELEPRLVKEAQERLFPPGTELSGTQMTERIVLFYRGLIRVCTDVLDRIVRRKMESARPSEDRSAIVEIKKKYELSDSFKVDLDESAFQEREVTHFKNLKHIALVVTKSDKHPIVYPPDQYPKKKLPACELHLRDIQDYLKLCGGQVRCYNASATGYTLLSGGTHLPGPANTQTPINILEPLFDMLSITG